MTRWQTRARAYGNGWTKYRKAFWASAIVLLVVLFNPSTPRELTPERAEPTPAAKHLSRRPRGFRDTTRAAGLDHIFSGTWGSQWADYNLDGTPDVVIGRHGANSFFFRARVPATYRRIKYDFVTPRGYKALDGDDWVDRHSCAWGEATGDGIPDLYCTVGANLGTSVGPNQLLTFGPGGLREVAKRYRLRDSFGRGRSINWLDFDSDGDLDVYIGNWARANRPSGLFKNRRGRFQRVRVGVEEQLRTISSSWSDWDRDGDPDLLVMQYAAPTVAYENQNGRFVRTSIPGVTGGHWYSAAWGDYNGDGYSDVHMVGESRAVVFKNDKGTFQVVHSMNLLDGRTSVWFDRENDGDLDLFVVQGAPGTVPRWNAVNGPDFLLIKRNQRFVKIASNALRGRRRGSGDTVTTADYDRDGRADLLITNGYFEYDQWLGKSTLLRNLNPARGWIALDLNGGRWNPLGVGARIRVATLGRTYWREVTDGVTFRSQSEVSHVLLGIGGAPAARVRVRWPGGGVDCLRVVEGRSVPLRKGNHPCRG